MSEIVIKEYNPADTEKLYGIFTEAHPYERVRFERFLRVSILDINFAPECLLEACIDGEPVGFVYTPKRFAVLSKRAPNDEKGYITLLSVKPGFDVAKIGGLLADEAEKRHGGASGMTTGYSPFYINQGFLVSETEYREIFLERGYSSYESAARSMDLSLYKKGGEIEDIREALMQDGFFIGALTPELITSYLDEENPFSSVGWAFEFKNRLLDRLDMESVRVAAIGGKVIGACVFGDPGSDSERFGPFGVDPEFRGRGIGKVLLSDCLVTMKNRGLSSAWMQWTPVSGPAETVYKKAGFVITKRYLTFSK